MDKKRSSVSINYPVYTVKSARKWVRENEKEGHKTGKGKEQKKKERKEKKKKKNYLAVTQHEVTHFLHSFSIFRAGFLGFPGRGVRV